jgi:uncharacterized protein (TIGR02246 family)
MRHAFRLSVAVTILAMAWSGLSMAQDVKRKDIKNEIFKLSKAYDAAVKAGDAKALEKLFDDDAQVILEDGRLLGKKQYIPFITGIVYESVNLEENSVRVFGDTAVEVGTWTVAGKEGGKPFSVRLRNSTVWVKKGGTWFVTVDHTTKVEDKK